MIQLSLNALISFKFNPFFVSCLLLLQILTLKSGSPCLEGRCNSVGDCILYCETLGLRSCTCNETVDACSICCTDADSASGICSPHPDFANISHINGWPCVGGTCNDGACMVLQTTDRVQRYFEYFVANRFLDVLKGNIVFVTQVSNLNKIFAPT